MAKYVSRRNPVSVKALKRHPIGSVVVHHWSRGEVRFVRVYGGWRVEREDSAWIWPLVFVSSAYVARECNRAVGCRDSWARVY